MNSNVPASSEIEWSEGAFSWVIADMNEHFKQLIPQPDETVYHYTNADVLLAIVQKNKLRASSMAYLNDEKEYFHGVSRFVDAIQKSTETTIILIRESLLAKLNDEHFQRSQRLQVYNCSFSHDGDLLSQWRGYADNGSGFAIGFDPVILSASHPNGFCYNTVYDERTQAQIAERAINTFGEYFSTRVNSDEVKTYQDVVLRLALGTIAAWAPAMKHKGFTEEREFRIIKNNQYGQLEKDDHIKWKTRKGEIIPFVEFDCVETDDIVRDGGEGASPIKANEAYLPINKIYVGPCHEFPRTEQSLRVLLKGTRHENIPVCSSSVPYLP